MFSKEFILVLVFIPLFKFSDEFNFKPDLENPLIPKKWRQRCGYRFDPKGIPRTSRCLLRTLVSEDEYYNRSIRSVRSVRTDPSNRVLGGRNVYPRESPWTVQIAQSAGYEYYPSCTGVLITMRHILTVAHCWTGGALRVYAGSDRSKSSVWHTNGLHFRIHDNYTASLQKETKELDIAIIELDSRIDDDYHGWDLMNFNTICLPQPKAWVQPVTEDWNQYQKATFYGWGLTGEDIPTVLQRGDTEFRYKEYEDSWNKILETKSGQNRTRSCTGDSGGGLIKYLDDNEERAVLIGIMAIGDDPLPILEQDWPQPCRFNYTVNTASIAVVPHLDWINDVLRRTSRKEDFD